MQGQHLMVPAVLVLVALVPVILAAEPEERAVAYEYRGAGSLAGTVSGTCAAYGAVLDPSGGIRITGSGVTITSATTWVNRTTVRPQQPGGFTLLTPLDHSRDTAQQDQADGTFHLSGGPDAVVALFPGNHPNGGSPTLVASWHAKNGTWTGARHGFSGPAHFMDGSQALVQGEDVNRVTIHAGEFPGGARGWGFEQGRLALDGSAVLLVRNAYIRGPDLDLQQPAYRQEIENRSAPLDGARVQTLRFDEAFIRIERLQLALTDTQATIACGTLDAEINGDLQVFQAKGNLTTNDQLVGFNDRVLEVVGEFWLHETPIETKAGWTVRTQATGSIKVIGLDFAPAVGPPDLQGLVAQIGVGAFLLGVLGGLAKKTTPAMATLYTRLRDIDVTSHEIRRTILEQLTKNAVVSEGDLISIVGHSRSTVRHHVEVLARTKRLRRVRLNGRTWVAGMAISNDRVRLKILQADDVLHQTHQYFQSGLSRPTIVVRLAEEMNVTTRTARKHVHRYESLVRAEPEVGTP